MKPNVTIFSHFSNKFQLKQKIYKNYFIFIVSIFVSSSSRRRRCRRRPRRRPRRRTRRRTRRSSYSSSY